MMSLALFTTVIATATTTAIAAIVPTAAFALPAVAALPPSSDRSATAAAQSSAAHQLDSTVRPQLAINITYRDQLKGALSVGEWEEANRLTSIILLQAGKQYSRGYLIAKDIRALPCKTLQEVDYWWNNSSNGHFGLSTQAQLWHQMKGKTFEDVTQFEDRIGWLGELDFLSTITAPKGHLPLRPVKPTGMADAWGGGWIQEMPKRLIACNIIEDPNPPAPKPAATPAQPAVAPRPQPQPKPASSPRRPAPAPQPAPAPARPPVRLRDILPPVEPRR